MINSLLLVACSAFVAGTGTMAGKQRPKHLEFLPKFWRPTMKPTPVEITPPPSITMYESPQVNQPTFNIYEGPQVNQPSQRVGKKEPEKFPQPWRPPTIKVSLPPTPRIYYNEPLLHNYRPVEPDYTNFNVEATFNDFNVNTQIRCVSDEDCLQHPRLSAGCPNFCIDGICAPRDDDTPPVLRFKTNMKVDHSRFKLREGEELERVFGGAALHYPKESLNGRFFEVVKGSSTVLEVKYPSDYFKVAAHQLEKLPGNVPGNQEVSAEGDHEKMDFGTESTTGSTTSSDTVVGSSFDYSRFGQSVHTGPFGQHRGLAIQGDSPNRWRVRNTDSNPWRRNGRLSMGCTASLIGNRVLLTAAHCVWDKDTDSWADFPSFAPGQDGNDKPLGEGQVVRMTIPAGYISCANNNDCRAHDWAVLVLRSSDTFNVGYFGFSTHKGDSRLNLPGYPVSKNRQMWYDHCSLFSDEGDWIKHRCDTERGNSGSAIYKIVDGGRYVVAVHGGGYANLWNRGADVDGQTSSAGRLYDRMLAYRREFG